MHTKQVDLVFFMPTMNMLFLSMKTIVTKSTWLTMHDLHAKLPNNLSGHAHDAYHHIGVYLI